MSQISLSSIPPSPSRRCRAATAGGRPRRAWAIKDTPYCAVHSGHDQANTLPEDPDPQPPRRRLETIDDVIADMFEKMARFSALIDQAEDIDSFLKMFAVYSRNATHLASLLRIKHSLPGNPADDLMSALGQAINEVGKELGVDLSHL